MVVIVGLGMRVGVIVLWCCNFASCLSRQEKLLFELGSAFVMRRLKEVKKYEMSFYFSMLKSRKGMRRKSNKLSDNGLPYRTEQGRSLWLHNSMPRSCAY